jgi:hypothetical protein
MLAMTCLSSGSDSVAVPSSESGVLGEVNFACFAKGGIYEVELSTARGRVDKILTIGSWSDSKAEDINKSIKQGNIVMDHRSQSPHRCYASVRT